MWGTDWTRAVGLLTYQQGVDAFRDTDRLSESDKATLMGGTLQRVYKWSPKGRDASGTMNWLVKEEPTHYGFDALVKDKKAVWSGVRNALAQKHLRAVKKGDRIFYYHTGDEKAVVGIAKALSDAYPDPEDASGKYVAVDVAPVKRLPRPVTLAEIKADAALQGLSAGPHRAAVGDAGHRCGVGADREAWQVRPVSCSAPPSRCLRRKSWSSCISFSESSSPPGSGCLLLARLPRRTPAPASARALGWRGPAPPPDHTGCGSLGWPRRSGTCPGSG